MTAPSPRYYRRDLALVHHLGYGYHAEACAPGILGLLEPVRARRGLVVELGCGSGLLAKHLIDAGHRVVATDDWAIITEFDVPNPNRFVRHIAVFIRNDDGSWRRDDERHDNVLVDTAQVPALFAGHGVEAAVGTSFGGEQLPAGLRAIIGRRGPQA